MNVWHVAPGCVAFRCGTPSGAVDDDDAVFRLHDCQVPSLWVIFPTIRQHVLPPMCVRVVSCRDVLLFRVC